MPDKETVKEFFIKHTEKIIFGVFVLFFLLMIWGGFSLPSLSIKPQDLANSYNRGEAKLKNSQPDEKMLPAFEYQKEATLSAKAISPEAFAMLQMPEFFRHPIAQPQEKRSQPPVLALKDLRVNSGTGFSPSIRPDEKSKDPLANLKPGVRWVVVTALIPFEEQEKLYVNTFKKADVKYDSDKPVYYGYCVEREEITESGSSGWKPLDAFSAYLINRKYSESSTQDVVDSKFLIQSQDMNSSIVSDKYKMLPMSMNLLNLSKHQWSSDCAHAPEIPSITSIGGAENTTLSSDNLEGEMGFGAEDPLRSMGGAVALEKPPTYKLFRFFDTKVEGGKQYRYRIKLLLLNPNYKVRPDYVENESLVLNPIIEGNWSEPSPAAQVPLDTRILCIGDRETSDSLLGLKGKLMILKFDEDTGEEITKTINPVPGSLLNFYNSKFDQSETQQSKYDRNEKNYEDEKDPTKKDFITNTLVLDFFSGAHITPRKNIVAPSRALIIDQNGRILISSEITDKSFVFQKSTQPELNSETSNSGRVRTSDPDSGRPTRNKPRGGKTGSDFDFI